MAVVAMNCPLRDTRVLTAGLLAIVAASGRTDPAVFGNDFGVWEHSVWNTRSANRNLWPEGDAYRRASDDAASRATDGREYAWFPGGADSALGSDSSGQATWPPSDAHEGDSMQNTWHPSSTQEVSPRYRFRGDPPQDQRSSPAASDAGQYHFRPLSETEKARIIQTPNWRPLESRSENVP